MSRLESANLAAHQVPTQHSASGTLALGPGTNTTVGLSARQLGPSTTNLQFPGLPHNEELPSVRDATNTANRSHHSLDDQGWYTTDESWDDLEHANNSLLDQMRGETRSTLRARIRKKTERRWAWGALATYTLSVAGTGLAMIGAGKAAVIVATCSLAGGLIGAAIGVGICLIGIGVTYLGHLIGKHLGQRKASQLRIEDPAVAAGVLKRIDHGLKRGQLPAIFNQVVDEAFTEVQTEIFDDSIHLPQQHHEVVKNSMRCYLRDQLNYFGSDFTFADARRSLESFGLSLVHEQAFFRESNGPEFQLTDPETTRHNAEASAKRLLQLLVQDPPADARVVTRAMVETYSSLNVYSFIQAQAAKDSPVNRDTAVTSVLSAAISALRAEATRSSPIRTGLRNPLGPRTPAAQIFSGLHHLMLSAKSGEATQAACRQLNGLLVSAVTTVTPFHALRTAQSRARQLMDQASAATTPTEAEKQVALEAAALAGQNAALLNVASGLV